MKVTPDRETFVSLAIDHDLIPIRTQLLGDRDTAVSVFEALALEHEDAFLLESVEGGDTWARWSFVGWDALFTVVGLDSKVEVVGNGPDVGAAGPLEALEQIVGAFRVYEDDGLPPLHSGLVGYLAYDVVRQIEHLPDRPNDDRLLPTMVWHAVGSLAAVDRFTQAVTLVRNVVPGPDPGASWDEARDYLAAAVGQLDVGGGAPHRQTVDFERKPDAKASMSRAEFVGAVETAVDYIEAGDAFQIVPSIRFEVPLEVDPFSVYRALRIVNPSPYMFFVRHGDMTIAGSSPELMVRVRDGQCGSRGRIAGRSQGTR
jgi:anthranilate synthase component 1